ncbi:uncharacterized protein LOC144304165 isoform X2 [Canis aureus]
MTRGEELGEMAFYKTPYDTWALELLQHHPVLYGFRCLYLSGCLALSPHHGAFIHPEVPLGFHLRCCGLRPLSRKKAVESHAIQLPGRPLLGPQIT